MKKSPTCSLKREPKWNVKTSEMPQIHLILCQTHYCFSSGRDGEVDLPGRTALMLAALKGHVGVMRLLIAADANVEAEAW